MERNIFIPKQRYIVKIDFMCGLTHFFDGEILIFVCGAYSPYDDSFAYLFHNKDGGEKTWWMQYDEPLDTWEQYFEPFNG